MNYWRYPCRLMCATLALCLISATTSASGATLDVDPYPVIAGEQAVVHYNPAGRVLDSAGQVYVHFGFNGWNPTNPTDPAMSWNAGLGVWEYTIDVPASATQLDVVFNDGFGTWDNNSGADWHIYAIAEQNWVLDGTVDADATLVASNNGYDIYAGMRGTTLYLAFPAAANGNDHFIFLTDALGSLAPAPWDKNGGVASYDIYLGNEVDNGWAGWFDTAGPTEIAVAGTVETTIDIVDEFGAELSNVYLAFGAYPTNGFTSLADQVPASQDGGDGNIEANEFLNLNLDSIRVGCGLGDVDKDCDEDADDYTALEACLLGPDLASCASGDLDQDVDVDVTDVAMLMLELGTHSLTIDYLAQNLGVDVTRFYREDANLLELPPSMSMETEPTVYGVASGPFDLFPQFFEAGNRQVAYIDVPDDVSLYGTGEIAGSLLRNGKSSEAWNSDRYGWGISNPSLYQSHPWVLGVRSDGTAFGVLADTTYRCRIDLTIDILFAAEGPTFPVYIFEGATPQDVIVRLTDFIGRISLPPMWALGYQQSRFWPYSDVEALSLAQEFRNRNMPCDVLWFDIDYMDGFRVFTFDPTRYPDPVWLNNSLHAIGFKSIWMIDPGVKAEAGYFVSDSGSAGDHWVLNSEGGSWYTGEVWPGQCYFPDFTRPETRAWWADLYANFMAMGLDGVWNDMNEPGIFDGPGHTMPIDKWHRGGGGLPAGPHNQYHNVYGMLMVKASREGIMAANPNKRPFVLSRANFIGGHRYAAMWTGDNTANWDHLTWSISMALNIGLSAQPFCGPDVGGFIGDGTGDLFARWMGIGTFIPFFRNHQDNQGMNKEPWSYGTSVENSARTSLQRRYRLMPYLYTLFQEASVNGLPIMRPLFFADPADPDLRDEDVAFLFGADVLVVPNVSEFPGSAPTPDLPDGIWRSVSLVGEDASTDVTQPDVRVRGGAILPLGPVMQHTSQLALDPLTLVVSLDASGYAEGWLYEDDGDGYDYEFGDYRLCRYTATQSGNTVTIEVAEILGSRPTPVRTVNIEVVTDSGVYTGSGSDVDSGVIATVNVGP
jgi:alpha-glucosidase